jgi:hypothetical protein
LIVSQETPVVTFAEHRQTVLQACALSSDFFAEDVTIGTRTVRVKIEHESLLATGKPRPVDQGTRTVAEFERILVLVSRDASETDSLPDRPQPGEVLVRSADRDKDTRPFQFAGDIEFEGDQHAKYFFQRPRRVAQGGGR